ncbi:P-loop containing nucleoside triphosphate hydrolase protein [Lasiodiplodia theobromae]|uniref:P-loop containing nucleoside triphosphate hydrolase protein n=1 Tax=Lasiodiplodia theobromae TaxID=45133 RepID=UPI0015C2DB99|nr:P-loop containing nucleoside triphosphate hydrolase protein [Lasiodiplodia theobromae]KAF4544193.1 P-loop containing nucleoside triphosphate hydrolase protein [Lasiodiplodia theobromae]
MTSKYGSEPSSDLDERSPHSPGNPSRQSRIQNISHRVKKKTKKVLHVDNTEGLVRAKDSDDFDDVEANPAFNPQKVFQKPVSVGDALHQAKDGAQTLARVVVHPKDSAKRKAAAKLAAPEQPFLSQQADKVLLDAHDRLEAARKSSDGDDEDNAEAYEEEVQSLQAQRESLRVAWTTSRFVHRVRVVPAQYIEHPRFKDVEIRDSDGAYVGTDWTKFWGNCCLYATQDYHALGSDALDQTAFSRHLLIEHLERILMASAPWQSYFLKLRGIYLWENPRKSGRWMAIFVFLWWADYVFSFILLWCVFIVLRSRYSQRSIKSLRESHERVMDQGATAFKISELIHRHGPGEWLDPLIDEIGPRAQLQLNDLADHLERMQNFYDWKFPERTWATLFCIACAILLGVLTPTAFSMRVLTFVAIWWFFMGRPVASHYPRFRRAVSPVSYVFWGLPTHAQWSFRYLSNQAQRMRARTAERAAESGHSMEQSVVEENNEVFVDAPSFPGEYVNFLTFRCRYHGIPARLAISASGISLIRLFPAKQLWSRHFYEISEMRKTSGSALGRGLRKVVEGKTLEFAFIDGEMDQIEAVRRRDEAFNSIIGFSNLMWQMLDPAEGTNEQEVEGG